MRDGRESGCSQCDDLTPLGIQAADAFSRLRLEKRPAGGPRRPEVRREDFLGMGAVIASPAMRRLVAMAARIGRTNCGVLVTGERGVRKELIARAIHHYSLRASRPFVDINCAALPEHLMESELFGYEKGAFSGAESAKPGLFETAHTGTLFLDEIGELDSRMQAKLLRVLDGQSYFRLGGFRKILTDVRVVAATNLNLDDAIRHGKFRPDLFHRLDASRLHVPPLRERREDIPPLAMWFLRDSPWRLTADAMALLERYSWPGNVRELQNSLNKAALFAAGPDILPHDLPPEILQGGHEPVGEQYSLNGLERQTIHRVLAQTGGHQQRAADLLGISRRTLIRKLKLYRSSDQFQQAGKHLPGKRSVA